MHWSAELTKKVYNPSSDRAKFPLTAITRSLLSHSQVKKGKERKRKKKSSFQNPDKHFKYACYAFFLFVLSVPENVKLCVYFLKGIWVTLRSRDQATPAVINDNNFNKQNVKSSQVNYIGPIQ